MGVEFIAYLMQQTRVIRGSTFVLKTVSQNSYLAPGKAELSVGIMSVVTDMGRNVEDEREPAWDERLLRWRLPPCGGRAVATEVTVVYRYADVSSRQHPQM